MLVFLFVLGQSLCSPELREMPCWHQKCMAPHQSPCSGTHIDALVVFDHKLPGVSSLESNVSLYSGIPSFHPLEYLPNSPISFPSPGRKFGAPKAGSAAPRTDRAWRGQSDWGPPQLCELLLAFACGALSSLPATDSLGAPP